jgi:hypothetical protein
MWSATDLVFLTLPGTTAGVHHGTRQADQPTSGWLTLPSTVPAVAVATLLGFALAVTLLVPEPRPVGADLDAFGRYPGFHWRALAEAQVSATPQRVWLPVVDR